MTNVHRFITATIAAVAIAAAGCSSDSSTPQLPTPAPTSTPSSATPSPTPSPTPTEPAGPARIGDQQTITIEPEEGEITTTAQVVSYTQPYKGPQPPEDFESGDVWGVIDVKLCAVEAPENKITVSQFPWSLEYDDGTVIEVTGSYGGDSPKPEYPMDRTVKVGRCVRGKIAFPVPSKKRPDRVVYAPGEGEFGTWEWELK